MCANLELWPIPNHKTVCAAMAPKGWAYTGFSDGCYCFQRGDYRTGFYEIQAWAEDLTPENLQRMADLGVTRTSPPVSQG